MQPVMDIGVAFTLKIYMRVWALEWLKDIFDRIFIVDYNILNKTAGG